MMSLPIIRLRLIPFLFLFSFISKEFKAQTIADKDFYLIDGLVLEELFPPDKKLLDSCLKLYHRSAYDTVKIAALGHVCEHMEHKIWINYQYLLFDIIEQKMVHSPDNLFLKESFSDALNNLGYINLTYKKDFSKAIEYGKQALTLRQNINKPEKVAGTMNLIGSSYVNQGNMLQAEEYISKSLSIQREMGNLRGEVLALGNLIHMYHVKGDVLKILEYATRRIEIYKILNDQRGIANALGECGLYYTELGDTTMAMKYSLEALTIAENCGEKKDIASALNQVGSCHWKQGDLIEALEYFQKSIVAYKNSEDGVPAHINVNLGQFYNFMGDQPKALKYFMEALEISRAKNEMIDAIRPLIKMGTIYSNQNDTSKAFKYYRKALIISRRLGNWQAEASVLNALGNAYQVSNELGKSIESYSNALILFEKIEDADGVALVLHNMGTVYEKKNKIEDALASYEKSLDLYMRNGTNYDITQVFATLARIYMEQGKFERALVYAQQGFELAKKSKSPSLVKVTAEVLYQIFKKLNQNKEALEMHLLYTQMKDSIDGFEIQQVLDKIEFKRSLERKNQRIRLLRKERELKDKSLRLTLTIYSLVLCAIIMLVWGLFRYRKKCFENELQELRRLKIDSVNKSKAEDIVSMKVNAGRKLLSINIDNVVAFKGESNYVFLITQMGESHIVDFTLNFLEEKLPAHFKRIHRSHIINTKRVKDIIKLYRGKLGFVMNDKDSTHFSSSIGYSDNVKRILEKLRPSNF